MKKLLTLALALVLCLSLAACDSTTTATDSSTDAQSTSDAAGESENSADAAPEDSEAAAQSGEIDDEALALYEALTESMQDVTSMAMKADVDITLSADGETESMTTSIAARVVMRSETDVDMDMTMSVMGESMSILYVDGYAYMETMGQKIKAAMDISDLYDSGDMTDMPEIDASNIISSSVTEQGSDKELRFVVASTYAADLMGDDIASSLAEMGVSRSSADYSDVEMVVVIDENNMPKSQTMACTISVAADGEEVVMELLMTSTFSEINAIESIALPADADEYVEVQM